MDRISIATCVVLLCSAPAAADAVLVMPVAGDTADDSPDATAIIESVIQVLEMSRHQPHTHEQACDSIECVEIAVRAQSADAAVLVRTFEREAQIYEVAAIVVRASGAHGNGREPIEAGALRRGIVNAVMQALADRPEQLAHIRIEGTAGAAVTIDGNAGGELPAEIELPHGEHTIAVSKYGYEDYRETLEIDRDRVIEVELTPLEGGGPNVRPPGRAAGIAFLVAGVTLAAGEIVTGIALRGCETPLPGGSCNDRQIGTGLGIVWGAAALVAITAGLVLVLKRGPANSQTQLRITPAGLALRRDF